MIAIAICFKTSLQALQAYIHTFNIGGLKMNDIYLMNKETGEIVPSKEVFNDFYKTHGIYDSVFDFWAETDLIVENSYIDIPNFTNAIKI